jgi:hypothetical protein
MTGGTMAIRIALVFALFSSAAAAADWLTLTDAGAPTTLLLDKDSVVPISGTPKIKAWVRYIHTARPQKVGGSSANAAKEYTESLTLYHINCGERTQGVAQSILYAKSGEVLDSGTNTFVQMNDVAPDTLGEEALESACELHKIKTAKP